MIPPTHAGARTPAWPGGGGARPARPETSTYWPCGPEPPDRGRGAWHVADIDIDGARGPEREKRKLARATRMRWPWGSSERPPKQARRAKYQADLDGLAGF